MISIIVPTYNEEEFLARCLDSVLAQQEKCQLIISDGGSKDGTLEIARRYTGLIISREMPDLTAQLNAGAGLASGEILLFLHADSKLAPGSLARFKKLPEQVIGGTFTMKLDGNRSSYRLLELGGNIYCRLTHTYFGDRGIFVRTDAFQKLGGFKPLPIMADVEFSHRLKRLGKTALLKGPVVNSARKFDRESPWRSIYLIVYALLAFRLGVDPEKIKKKYYQVY